MIPEESSETVEVIGRGTMIREWRCPFCHEPVKIVDPIYYIWSCELCGALYSGGMGLRYYDPETEIEDEDLRFEPEYISGCDA